ncbi:hypothetical protein H1230_06660 [Paenibacillus sp. 19GGS1-52]|uniref:hypothetical protein n=1 Tax=Paenibacillus sp. 19GGS1-52 TaxID=2758563 RepID=UPI001EFB82AC|nr:hypothetical protein [Paenibacillus sp. 19GGS1-52]ULO08485.1 hypothetical protein H1230_06660 [Paenibacillus sp. 19GGS1-52]
MDFWRNNTIWFDEVPIKLFRNIDLKDEKITEITHLDLEYLILWHYKHSKLGNFANIPEGLRYLELNSSNIQNFIGLERLGKLNRMELHYCTKLQNDDGLSKVANTLEYLHINQSKKFVPTKELFSLKNLRVLCLNSCGDLESLKFLNEFPNLIDFRFVNTNVIDGDLSPIIEHPTIRTVGFLNKRHYNISEKEMDTKLSEKNHGEEFKIKINKQGTEFSTFRYKY